MNRTSAPKGTLSINSFNLAIVELNERIVRIDDEAKKLHKATVRIESFGLDYDKMTEKQKIEHIKIETAESTNLLQSLDNKDSLERFAREQYKMHADDETIYLVE